MELEPPLDPAVPEPEDGLVLEELEPAPVPPPPAEPPPLSHAVSERKATTERTAVAVLVSVVFIRNSLKDCRFRKSPRAAATALRSL